MKTTDFLNENFVEDAAAAQQDHEVQMARADCYNAAKYAIELHKLLKNISEQEGLDGWVSEKITLANDYLRTVTEYLRYEQESSSSDIPTFDIGSATQTLDAALGESAMPAMQEGTFTWYLKAHGRLLGPSTSETPYKFNSREEALAFAKKTYKTNWQNITATADTTANYLDKQQDPGWNDKKLHVREEEPEPKRKPVVVKTNKEIGTRVADIGPGGKEYNVKTNKAWDDEHKQEQGVAESVEIIDQDSDLDQQVYTLNVDGKKVSFTYWDYENNFQSPDIKDIYQQAREQLGRKLSPEQIKAVARAVFKSFKQGVAEGKADPVGSWVVYDGSKVKRFKSRDGAKTYAEKNGGKVASSEFYADKIQKQGVAEGEQGMSRAAKGYEKYGKEGMQALAKAGREGASEKELDAIRDKHDKYDKGTEQDVAEGLQQTLRKVVPGYAKREIDKKMDAEKFGRTDVDRDANYYRYKKIQDKLKEQSVSETTSSGSVATSMGGGNGFANGGPGTIARPRMKKKK